MSRNTQAGYLLRESFAGFRRRKLTTAVTILIMGSSLLVLAVFVLVTLNLGALLGRARSGIDLRVFLVDGLSRERQTELQPHFLAIPGVESARFITREQSLVEFRRDLGEEADVLDLLDENPLPDSYHLELTDAARTGDDMARVAQEVKRWPEVQDVAFSQAWVDELERWTHVFQMASLVVSLIVLVAAVFVISNTVRLTMDSQARVIEIQKLVGATNGFIRLPLLAGGVIQGVLGGVVAMGGLAAAHALFAPRLAGVIFFSPAQIAGFVLLCALLGVVGSWTAMHKHLGL